MKTKYFNEYTGEVYETEEEALKSERAYEAAQEAKKKAEEQRLAEKKKKDTERAARAKEVQEALDKAIKARKEYQEKLASFCTDYGAFHFSTNDFKDFRPVDFFDLFDGII